MVVAQVEGFAETGMLCSAKHFPGIGAAVGDSHVVGITSYSTLDELAAVSWSPFVRAIEAGVPMVMVGHISLPTVTGTRRPRAWSRRSSPASCASSLAMRASSSPTP